MLLHVMGVPALPSVRLKTRSERLVWRSFLDGIAYAVSLGPKVSRACHSRCGAWNATNGAARVGGYLLEWRFALEYFVQNKHTQACDNRYDSERSNKYCFLFTFISHFDHVLPCTSLLLSVLLVTGTQA
jgi:hypothetical protein